MKTPYFIIKENELKKNIDDFRLALKKLWPNSIMSYSVKTNSLPWLLRYMKKNGIYAEVVSDEEYSLAELCGFDNREIVFNGPIKSNEKLKYAITNHAIVNLDSKKDLDTMLEMEMADLDNIGVRINIETGIFSKEDIGYEEDGFRFGFSDGTSELAEVIRKIKEKYMTNSFGLHLHCNSVTRSLGVYKCIAEYARNIIVKYDLKPAFIDIGGGFFGGVEGKPTPEQYIEVIRGELEQVVDIDLTKLIIEPGSAIIGSVIDLYTSVLDVKDTAYSRIVTTDGSRIHIDPLWKKSRYLYKLKTKAKKKCDNQIICGYTCMDHDRLMKLQDELELQIGDQIIYQRVGAYTVTFGGMFIRYLPDVYVKKNNKEVEQLRTRISVDEYIKINSQKCM